jgi:hypothetical protein
MSDLDKVEAKVDGLSYYEVLEIPNIGRLLTVCLDCSASQSVNGGSARRIL